jgi:hypothetical protein
LSLSATGMTPFLRGEAMSIGHMMQLALQP